MKAVRQFKSQAGFSLIELMIVVAIIGILASIAVPNFQKFQRRAKQSEGKGYLSGVYTAENGFKAEWSSFTTDLVCIGFKDNSLGNGGTGLAGRGNYVVGFKTDNALVTGTTCAAANNLAGPAPAATGIPTALTDASTAAIAAGVATFTAATEGIIGGAANDRWTINQAKTVTNAFSGL